MHKIVNFWINLRASLWFIPGLMLTCSIFAALILIDLDSRINREWLIAFPSLFGLGADGSRGMLTAIASSMLTVVALTFALTLNAMTQASGQFTPRIFRNFMRDRVNQFVLGYFVSVFAYCLLVLRTIRGGDELKFVPSIAVLVGLVLALGGIIALIFFIHHIADSLQITTIISRIVDETIDAIKGKFPKEIGRPAGAEERENVWKAEDDQKWIEIPAMKSGYVQSVDSDGLFDFAEEYRVIARMDRGVGQFVGRGISLVSLTTEPKTDSFKFVPTDEEVIEEINDFFNIGRHRTIDQDIGFGIRQIVDIALKALSPGVNDTTTAVNCIDHLGEIVGEIARRELPSKIRAGKDGGRIIVLAPDLREYVESAFDQIRISGKANLAIFIRLLEAIEYVAHITESEQRRIVLKEQIIQISEYADRTLETDYEKKKFGDALAKTRRTISS